MNMLLDHKREIGGIDSDKMEVEYYITVDTFIGFGEAEMETYGICIKYGEQQTSCRGITFRRHSIERLLKTLSRCEVTPIALPDVLDDILDEYC